MALRVVLSLLAITVTGIFGQTTPTLKAGDPAPNLAWTRVLSAPGPPGQSPANLFGKVTVLLFLPNVTVNEDLVTRWNSLVGKFVNQPVQFVWITSEKMESVAPWIEKHPVSGWLLLDSDAATQHAYGIDTADVAVVDTNGKIAGFTSLQPEERQIQAVQDGRAVAMAADTDENQIDNTQLEAILAGRLVRLNAESRAFPAASRKPGIPPSYDVHISPSKSRGTESSSGPDFWVERGFELKSVISTVYETELDRIILPSSLDDHKQYDFVLAPPGGQDPEMMRRLLRQGIEKYFQVSVSTEKRPVEVYVMTAVEGKTPKPKADSDFVGGGFISWSSREIAVSGDGTPTLEEIRRAASEMPAGGKISEISAMGATMDEFRRALEQGLTRPIIDETKLTGTYDLAVHGNGQSTDEFLRALRDQIGLLLTPAVRTIDMLVVTPQR